MLQDQDVVFPREFDPRTWKGRRPRRVPFGLGVAAAAAALLALAVVEHPTSLTRVLAPHSPTVAGSTLKKDPWQLLGMVPESSVPLWTKPEETPFKEILYTGAAAVEGFHASQVVAVDAGSQTKLAVGFENDQPAWVRGSSSKPVPVSLSPIIAAATGRWQAGGNTPLSSFAAAGSNVYLTFGPEWALLTGAMNVHWANDPASDAVQGEIQALPGSPENALLLTQSASGDQSLFLLGSNHQWQQETPPQTPITQLVALGHQYWAVANGMVYVSADGVRWTPRYTPPRGFSVAAFAVGQTASGKTLAAVSLAPLGEPGVGPVYLSKDGGASWRNIGVPWPNGSSPQQLVVTPDGGVAALLPGPPVVLEQWVPSGGQWQMLSLPRANMSGIGQLTAFSNGDLLYADGQGKLYRYLQGLSEWQPLPSPPGIPAGETPNLLTAIGSGQVLLSYREGWWILVLH